MVLWRYTIEVDLPIQVTPTKVLGAMADAALRLDCYVAEQAGMERVDPPLKVIKGYGGTSGD